MGVHITMGLWKWVFKIISMNIKLNLVHGREFACVILKTQLAQDPPALSASHDRHRRHSFHSNYTRVIVIFPTERNSAQLDAAAFRVRQFDSRRLEARACVGFFVFPVRWACVFLVRACVRVVQNISSERSLRSVRRFRSPLACILLPQKKITVRVFPYVCVCMRVWVCASMCVSNNIMRAPLSSLLAVRRVCECFHYNNNVPPQRMSY